jgi:hypothetical protein
VPHYLNPKIDGNEEVPRIKRKRIIIARHPKRKSTLTGGSILASLFYIS